MTRLPRTVTMAFSWNLSKRRWLERGSGGKSAGERGGRRLDRGLRAVRGHLRFGQGSGAAEGCVPENATRSGFHPIRQAASQSPNGDGDGYLRPLVRPTAAGDREAFPNLELAGFQAHHLLRSFPAGKGPAREVRGDRRG